MDSSLNVCLPNDTSSIPMGFESPKDVSVLDESEFSNLIHTDNSILVVDDDNFNILALQGLLQQFN